MADEVRVLAEESARAARNIGHSAQSTRKVIASSAKLMDEIGSRLHELSQASESLGTGLSQITQTAEETRKVAEQMSELPRANLKVAIETQRFLKSASAAAARSADDAAAVTATLDKQIRSVRDLSQQAAKLATLTTDLRARATFFDGNEKEKGTSGAG